MPLSKKRNKERMRLIRGSVQPSDDIDVEFPPKNIRTVIGRVVSRQRGEFVTDVQPTCNLEPVQPNETSRLVQPRPYSKDRQLNQGPGKHDTFNQLRSQFDYRRG